MRRIGKLLGRVGPGRDVAARPPCPRRSRERQVAGDRPGLRADRQGGRDARGPGQAARYRGPRGGQAGLRPRDDQAARPARGDREDPRPRQPRAASPAAEWPVEKWGPVGAFLGWTIHPEFWDDQPFILVDYLPLRRRIVAETSRPGSRGSPTSRPRPPTRRPLCKSWRPMPKPTAAALTAFVRGSKLPVEDRRRSPSWPPS